MTRADECDLAMPTKSHLIFIPNTQKYETAIPFRPCMKSATNTVLMGMAACDLVTIILPAPW